MLLCSEYEHVGLYTHALQLLHAVLCGLCLELACSLEIGDISKVYAHGALAQLPLQLPDGLEEGRALYVAYGTSYLCDDEVVVILLPQELDVALYLVGDMRHHLNGFAQIVAPALLVYDALVYSSGGHGVGLGGLNACESLVVSEVQVGLHAVYGHVALTVLIGIERAGIDVNVRVKLLDGDVVTSCLQELTDGRRDDALS